MRRKTVVLLDMVAARQQRQRAFKVQQLSEQGPFEIAPCTSAEEVQKSKTHREKEPIF